MRGIYKRRDPRACDLHNALVPVLNPCTITLKCFVHTPVPVGSIAVITCITADYFPLTSWWPGVIKWKHFLSYWPFVRGIHWSPMDSPNKGQWRGALMFSFMCAWSNGWANSPDARDLRRHGVHCDITVMIRSQTLCINDDIQLPVITDWLSDSHSISSKYAINSSPRVQHICVN